MERDNWTLLAISAAKESGLTPAQLQKTLFLLGKAFNKKLTPFYEFEPYNYGPFDKNIYKDAEILAINGYVTLKSREGRSWVQYCISDKGQQAANSLVKKADKSALVYLSQIVDWSRGLTFSQLIASIYTKYPEYRINSVFKG